MKAGAVLEIACSDQGVRKSLESVLAPDNEGGPRGLAIELNGEGNRLEIRVGAESPATALSTSLGFLRDVALFQEVWLLSRRKPGRARGARKT